MLSSGSSDFSLRFALVMPEEQFQGLRTECCAHLYGSETPIQI